MGLTMFRWLNDETDLPEIELLCKQPNSIPFDQVKTLLEDQNCLGIVLVKTIQNVQRIIGCILYTHSVADRELTILHVLRYKNRLIESTLVKKVISKLKPYRMPFLSWYVPEHDLAQQIRLRDWYHFVAKGIVDTTIHFTYNLPAKYCTMPVEENAYA